MAANPKPTEIPNESTLASEQEIKHPLQHEWVLWYDNLDTMKKMNLTWDQNLKMVYKFSTVEDFWSLWNNIKPPSSLATNSNYHLFKSGIEPKWEDQANQYGGKWILVCPTKNRNSLNDMWLGLALQLIGNCFEDDEDIAGAVISLKPKGGDKVAIWTKTADNKDMCLRIGRQFLKAMELESGYSINYQIHADAKESNTGYRNPNKYSIDV